MTRLTTYTEPPLMVTFSAMDGGKHLEVGRLYVKDGKLHFEGEMSRSAEVFAGYLREIFEGGDAPQEPD